MILSRYNLKPSNENVVDSNNVKNKSNLIPTFDEFVAKRDYVGILTLIECNAGPDKNNIIQNELWRAFAHFRLGEYRKAIETYEKIKRNKESNNSQQISNVELLSCCCKFYLGESIDQKFIESYDGPYKPLAERLKIYLDLKNDESTIESMDRIQKVLSKTVEDQLCLASVHFYRNQYQEAIDIYKKILLEDKNYLALNVYIALCYYLLDYYDVSQEVLALYWQKHPKSIIASNLKACNNYRLYNGTTAEMELRNLIESFPTNFSYAKDFIRHNLVVFLNGEGAFQVLPSLMRTIPEAKLNLTIFYLKNDKNDEADNLIKNVEPKIPIEYILKAIINSNIGQSQNSHEHLKIAQNYFQLVGSSPAECDTIQGRQCMASYFFLIRQFEEVVLYLSSIKSYFYNDDAFNFNYGQAKMMMHSFKEAEEALLMIENENLKKDLVYICCLTRCYIMNAKPTKAWDMYLKYQQSKESTILLHLIANDCYKMGHFLVALRAFDILEKLDKSPEYWEGKRGAAAGVLQKILNKHDPIEHLYEAIKLLRNSTNPQANQMITIMKNYSQEM
ncbi:tetratricopeptide repeat domain 26 [Dermatophagoides pteronyssinus]|uniref:tetratricopeptide repeat domain 26 n=1 Tax=Dermatophagoides pteronyssinus TaxID=6956 RepID=UPI003F66769D